MSTISETSLRAIVADDHPIITAALTGVLKARYQDSIDIQIATNGDELLDLIRFGQKVDFVMLDLAMPGRRQSVPLIQAVRKRLAEAKIIVYSADESKPLIATAMKFGADAYVTKGQSAQELLQALEVVFSGRPYTPPWFDPGEAARHPWITLTDAQAVVLLMTSKGIGLREIAERTGRSYKTAAAHKYTGLEKIGLKSSKELPAYIKDEGLSFEYDLRRYLSQYPED